MYKPMVLFKLNKLAALGFFLLLLFGCSGGASKQETPKEAEAEAPAVADPVPVTDTIIPPPKEPEPIVELPQSDIEVFTCWQVDEKRTLVSISDKYYPNHNENSSVVPDVEEMGKEAAQYFALNGKYRLQMMDGSGYSESDTLYLYDYETEKMGQFPLSELGAKAMIDMYTSEDDWPYDQYSYMIGFELKNLEGYSPYTRSTFAYIGSQNPFVPGQLTPIQWEEIPPNDFPSDLVTEALTYYHEKKSYETGKAYRYQTETSSYYLLALWLEKWPIAKRFMVVDQASGKKTFETIYYDTESTEFNGLNAQLTGTLFRDKPPVAFGFLGNVFGCPYITILDADYPPVPIHCDNRH